MPLFKRTLSKGDSQPKSMATWVRDQYLADIEAWGDLREDSRRHFDYVRGDFISEATKAELTAKGLPVLELNVILPVIIRILGAERSARALVKAIPLLGAKGDTAQAMTRLFEMVRVNSDGWRQIAWAWLDSLIADMPGWVEVRWQNDNDPLGQPIYERLNPFYVLLDAKCEKRNLKDASHVIKTWFATKDDILRDFPDKGGEINEQLQDEKYETNGYWSGVWERAKGYKASIDNQFMTEMEGRKYYRMLEAQVREEVRETRLFDPQSQDWFRLEDKEELVAMKKEAPHLMEVDWKQDRIRVVTTVMGDQIELQDADHDIQNGMFSLIPCWGNTFCGKPFGKVKNLEPAQDLYWKEMSASLHITNLTANPWILVPRQSMEPEEIKSLQEHSAKAGYVIEYDEVPGGGAPRREMINQPPASKLTLASQAQGLIQQTSGVGLNAQGQSDTSAESGELVKTRVSETMQMLEPDFDNKEEMVQNLHKYLVGVFQEKFTYERLLYYIDDSNTHQEFYINQITAHGIKYDMKEGSYGVAIDKGSARYMREEKLMKLLALAQNLGQPNPQLIDMIVKAFDDLTEYEKQILSQGIQEQLLGPEVRQLEAETQDQIDRTRQAYLKGNEMQNQLVGEAIKEAGRPERKAA